MLVHLILKLVLFLQVLNTEEIWLNSDRFAPSPDPSLTIKFYERSPEHYWGTLLTHHRLENLAMKNATAGESWREPHGSIGAAAGHRAIAQGSSTEIAEALFRYSAPEEVKIYFQKFI